MELEQFLENSKHRFSFDAWPRRVELAAQAKVRAFTLDPASFANDWSFEQRLVHGDAGYCDYFNNLDNPKQRVMVRVSEYPSHEDALLALLFNLTQSTAPTLPRLDERGINLGDVGFCGHGEEITSLIFVRLNVLIDIRSIGDEPVDVLALAQHTDDQIQALVYEHAVPNR